MRSFILIAVCSMSFLTLSAQTRLKWNSAYWLFGITNMSVETPAFGERWTFNADVVFSPWESIKGNPFKFFQVIPELRYYVKNAFDGFYTGIYFSWHDFKMAKWNYLNTNKYQKGNGYSIGAVIGYQVPVSARWSLDVYAGGGYQHSGYRGYDKRTGEMYVSWNSSAEWMPYKLGISFAYIIGRPKK